MGVNEADGYAQVEAEVPLAEMFGYATSLRSATQGKAEFTMEFAKYVKVPRDVSETLLKEYQGSQGQLGLTERMMQPELIERSPMRAVAASIRGGLEPGQVGAVLASAGVGKSAFMVQVALHSLLKGSPVLHVSLTDNQARVRSFYDEILAEVGQSVPAEELSRAQVSVERSRVIHSCLGREFGAADLRALMATLAEVMDFRPTLVMVDGLTADNLEIESLRQWPVNPIFGCGVPSELPVPPRKATIRSSIHSTPRSHSLPKATASICTSYGRVVFPP